MIGEFEKLTKMFTNFVAGYDIWTLYRYGGNLMFYPEITNRGAIPAYNVLVEVNRDGEKVFEHTYPVLDIDKPLTPFFMYLIRDGVFHSYAMGITVIRSIHKRSKNKVSGILYRIDETHLDITFDYFTKKPQRIILPLPKE